MGAQATLGTFFSHHQTYGDLQLSAERSCYICHWLLNWVKKHFPQRAEQNDTPRTPFIKTFGRSKFLENKRIEMINFSLSDIGPRKSLVESFEISPVQAATLRPSHHANDQDVTNATRTSSMETSLHRCPTPRLEHERAGPPRIEYNAINQTTNGATCVSLTRSWLKSCIKQHPECERLRNSEWYPTRVLDVDNFDLGTIRLLETSAHPLHGSYMTLSHSWGGIQILSLSRDNIDDFKRGISVTKLPQTFVDAIAVVRALGIRYLWIDSLCIIQDIPGDWADESSRMDHVYSHSFCNIGASAAANSAGGLFCHRSPDTVNPAHINFEGIDYKIFNARTIAINLNVNPLSKRGWVIQERWLCPRMIHFGSEQVSWECRVANACESAPKFSSRPTAVHLKLDTGIAISALVQGLEDGGVVAGGLGETWSALVGLYSAADLTYATDKLVAFSGVAKALRSQEHQDEYLAGLWRKNFIVQLAWRMPPLENDSLGQDRNYAYVAPSWSWASVRGGVVWDFMHYYNIVLLTALIDHHLDYVSSDSTGQVKSGWILLQGPLREMCALDADISEFRQGQYGYGVFTDVLEGGPLSGCYYIKDPGHSHWPDRVYCLPLFWGSWKPPSNSVQMLVLMLQLEPRTVDTFSRVGVVFFQDYQWSQRIAIPAPIVSLPGLAFDPDKGHTIKVI